MNNQRLVVSLGLLCFVPLALGHPGHLGDGLGGGFFHSLTGFDYVLLMFVGGGLWLSFR